MIIRSTLHNHCTLCDGLSTPEQMAQAAIDAGFTDFGMSCHSYAPFDPKFSVRDEDEYLRTIRELQLRYAPSLRIACGAEQDYFAPVQNREYFDYVIGSVHYVYDCENSAYLAVDARPEELQAIIKNIFGGDSMAFCRQYYKQVVNMASEQKPDVIGHFDLIVKNNGGKRFWDESDSKYRTIALEALEACAETGVIFEVNTRAVYRGLRQTPFPDIYLLKRLKELGAKVMINSDCHDASQLLFGLEDAEKLLISLGFKTIIMWENRHFTEIPLESI